MKTCPYHVHGCSTSTPCRHCRADDVRIAHTLARFEANGQPRKPVRRTAGVAHYTWRPDYWDRISA